MNNFKLPWLSVITFVAASQAVMGSILKYMYFK